MKTDVELRSDAMKILRKQLGLVEAERFLAMVGETPSITQDGGKISGMI